MQQEQISLIVKLKPQKVVSAKDQEAQKQLSTLKPLFQPQRHSVTVSSTDEIAEEMATYYKTEGSLDSMEELAKNLRNNPLVEAAYIQPPAAPPVWDTAIKPKSIQGNIVTPDFTSRQVYLEKAPEGVDARYAWQFLGGKGDGIKITDCEWAWNLEHEDLKKNKLGVIVGDISNLYIEHGTAVLGILSGDENNFGVTGISPDAQVGCGAFGNYATTIQLVADKLSPGDIILLEAHQPGPNSNGSGQYGYIAIEWWPQTFLAIKYATSKGIIVVEAAGNGEQNLDDPIYDVNPGYFPPSWKNPFNLNNPQSGAVIVGAGQPPNGMGSYYTDRARCGFSNYGNRVDCQGWGYQVTTTGYGGLQNQINADYTETFNGTSSASPIVVGSIACLQGILKAKGRNLLTSSEAASLLRRTGSPQEDAPSLPKTQRIGNRPDLCQLIKVLEIEK